MRESTPELGVLGDSADKISMNRADDVDDVDGLNRMNRINCMTAFNDLRNVAVRWAAAALIN